jgi:hypothetical protein
VDAKQFDTLAKTVFASSRRGLLGAVFAGALGRVGLGETQAQSDCKDVGASCGAGAECCSHLCRGRCVCRHVGQNCTANKHCCSSICQGNVCRCRADDHCGSEAFCCIDGPSKGLCEECCDHGDCGGDICCVDPVEGNRCVSAAESECGPDADCGIGNVCQDCEICKCDPEKCGAAMQGCCPPRRVEFCQFGDGPSGDGTIYCGKPGTTCDICDAKGGQKCDPQKRRCICDKAKCRQTNGCCHPQSKTCKSGDQAKACGGNGRTCEDCTKKGKDWVCRNKRCCKPTGTCPSSCPKDGACKGCCGGRCSDGKCENACGDTACPPGAPCCGTTTKRCCGVGQLCCNSGASCFNQDTSHCGACGKECLPLGSADRCVAGQCKCGNGPPCDCSKGAVCHDGVCVCGTGPINPEGDGARVCAQSPPGSCGFSVEGGVGTDCVVTGNPPLCECRPAQATLDGRCPMPS